MEERALLSTWHFPAVLGPVTRLNYAGKYVLTSRVYANVQAAVNTDINSFIKTVSKVWNNPNFGTIVGIGTLGTTPIGGYAPGSLLAKLDGQLAAQEYKIPFGGSDASVTGGLGLSVKTALTTTNPASANLNNESVAELLEDAINNSTDLSSAVSGMQTVRAETLAILANNGGPGLLPSYVETFGPGGHTAGTTVFGLKNS
jgi:muramoyltetrapeptide carboxypeptidase LdcA involved in peptidoglycan recycling